LKDATTLDQVKYALCCCRGSVSVVWDESAFGVGWGISPIDKHSWTIESSTCGKCTMIFGPLVCFPDPCLYVESVFLISDGIRSKWRLTITNPDGSKWSTEEKGSKFETLDSGKLNCG